MSFLIHTLYVKNHIFISNKKAMKYKIILLISQLVSILSYCHKFKNILRKIHEKFIK